MREKSFIFDLDGTLLDSMGLWEEIDREFLRKRGLELPDDYQRTVAPMENYEIADYTIRRFHLQDTPEQLVQEWQDMALRAYRDELELLPDVKETIGELHRRNIPMLVATSSCREFTVPALERNGILSMFLGIVTAQEVGRGKMFPDIYIRASEILNRKPEDIWVVEDLPEAVATAAAAGFCTIGLYAEEAYKGSGKEKIPPDRYAASFRDLLEILQ